MRTEKLSRVYYRRMRRKGYSDDLNISEDDLKKILGVYELRFVADEGEALADFGSAKNSQTQDLVL